MAVIRSADYVQSETMSRSCRRLQGDLPAATARMCEVAGTESVRPEPYMHNKSDVSVTCSRQTKAQPLGIAYQSSSDWAPIGRERSQVKHRMCCTASADPVLRLVMSARTELVGKICFLDSLVLAYSDGVGLTFRLTSVGPSKEAHDGEADDLPRGPRRNAVR
jgi:hypothetical protein